MKARIEEYEEKHNAFLRQFSLKAIADAFKECPTLAPYCVSGLPRLTITLNDMWEGKSAYKWKELYQKLLTSPSGFIIVKIERNCIVLTYAILPFFTSSIVKDLEDSFLLKQLEVEGVSVRLSSDLLNKHEVEEVCDTNNSHMCNLRGAISITYSH